MKKCKENKENEVNLLTLDSSNKVSSNSLNATTNIIAVTLSKLIKKNNH